MPDSMTRDIPADILARARKVRLACFDVDGTLTDGRLIYDADGRELKAFHATDGLGLKLLQSSGIRVELVTARHSKVAELRARELGVGVHTHVHDKLDCVRGIADEMGIGMDEVAFMGDDLADLSAMASVGLAVSPADAHHWTGDRAHWRTRAAGGVGAARELCDLLLAAKGQVEPLLEQALRSSGMLDAALKHGSQA
jgi:3-deoxy-D-manno-octulosonate 8-phosphate phosphatase (KDO 8-P phosphatase)